MQVSRNIIAVIKLFYEELIAPFLLEWIKGYKYGSQESANDKVKNNVGLPSY